MNNLTEALGKLFLIFFGYFLNILVGLYRAFIINKAIGYFLPQYVGILNIVQIWAILSIYSIITIKIDDSKVNEDTNVLIKRIFKSSLKRASKLSLAWLGFYLVKQFT